VGIGCQVVIAGFVSMSDKDFLACGSDDKHLLSVLDWDLAAADKVNDLLAQDGRLVFLDDVAAVGDYVHFILALHVGHC